MLRRRVVGRAPGDFVFTNSRGRPWNQNTWLRETWPAICRDAGVVGRTPHMLRHAHVAVMVAAGAQHAEIKVRLGHEDITTTLNTYGSGIGDVSSDALRNAGLILTGQHPSVGAVVSGEIVRQTRELEAP
jgi:integrase